jgi:hypothetical protein
MKLLIRLTQLLLGASLLSGHFVWAQSSNVLRPGDDPLRPELTKWTSSVSWETSSDYAESRSPRAYNHRLVGGLEYRVRPEFSMAGILEMRTLTIDGQIPKGSEQNYEELFSPLVVLSGSYVQKMFEKHSWRAGMNGSLFLDEASRLEGYKGLLGVNGRLHFNFFDGFYTMGHRLGLSYLMNSFEYGSNLKANPSEFLAYSLMNSLRITDQLRLGLSFSVRMTRYLDSFVDYNYLTGVSLTQNWEKVYLSLEYENGGFTEQGRVDFWYLNEFRRILSVSLGATF